MTTNTLRVLLVEPSHGDAQQILEQLRAAGYTFQHQHVADEAAYRATLSATQFDLVLCGCDTPETMVSNMLDHFRQSGSDCPFIILARDATESAILSAIRAGADDYILKHELCRLAPAIERNLREARHRLAYRTDHAALLENQARLQAYIADLPGMAYQMLLRPDGSISYPYVSEGSQALLGAPAQELVHVSMLFEALIHPNDFASYQQSMKESARKMTFWNWEGRILIQPASEVKWINLRSFPRKTEQGIMWDGIAFNITQSKEAELEIRRSKAKLQELSSHIQDVREQERISIAREVHDDLGSTLTAIKLDIAWLGNRLKDNPTLAQKAKDIEELVNKCATAANNISRNLRPSILDTFGVIAAIEIEANEFEQRTHTTCIFESKDEGPAIPPDISIALFRIFQETLANITKHAQASEVHVSISNKAEGISLIVRDNGRGLTDSDRAKPRSFGLRGIQERVEYFGGQVHFTSRSGKGTEIQVTIPHETGRITLDDLLAQQKLF